LLETFVIVSQSAAVAKMPRREQSDTRLATIPQQTTEETEIANASSCNALLFCILEHLDR
jgi:hypothetical protein